MINRPPSVVVFSPSPLLTITIEAGTNGSPEIHLHAGGQGFWVARMVASIGVPVALCGPFGDDSGFVLRQLIAAEGVGVRAIDVKGANGAYVHDRRSGERVVVAESRAGELQRHEVDDLYDATLVLGLSAQVTMLAGAPHKGIVPTDIYGRLSRDLRANGGMVLADLCGDQLRSALEGGLDLLKISHEEMIADGYAESDTVDHLLAGIDQLQELGAENIVVTRSAKPALARLQGKHYEVSGPQLEPRDYRGSGDSFTAGLAVGLATHLQLEEALCLAAAAGALNATRHGLGTGQRIDIEEMARHISVNALR
jgi:1-phosphofructokinase